MAKDNTIWILLGIIVFAVIAMKVGPGLLGTQAIYGTTSMAACQSQLALQRSNYPDGYTTECTQITQSILTCMEGCGTTSSGWIDDYMFVYNAAGTPTTLESCRAGCFGGGSGGNSCSGVTCSNYCSGTGRYYNGQCLVSNDDPTQHLCAYDFQSCTNGCSNGVCNSASVCTTGEISYDCADINGCDARKTCSNGQWGSCVKTVSSCGNGGGTSTTRGNLCITNSNCGTNEVCKATMATRKCMDLTLDSCSIACSDKNNAGIAGGCTIDYCHVSMTASSVPCYTSQKKGILNAYTDANQCVNGIGGAEQMDPAVGAASCQSGIVVGTTCTFPTGQELLIKLGTLTPTAKIVPSLSSKTAASTLTSGDLLHYSCVGNDDCVGSNASCISLQSLVSQGIITDVTKTGTTEILTHKLETGTTWAAAGAGSGLAICIGGAIAAGLAGTVSGGILIPAGAAIVLPMCGSAAIAGAAIAGTIAFNMDNYGEAVKTGDPNNLLGVCVSTSGSGDWMAWFTEQTIIKGIPNWGIVLAGFVILMLLIRR
jgi:hypothetical protein